MIEVVLALSLALGFGGLLIYLYFSEREQRNYIRKIQTDLTMLPIDLQKLYAQIAKENQQQTQKVMGDSFTKFLRHIEKLERMVLPKPVTTKDVEKVMERMGPLAENEIEKEYDKLLMQDDDNWTNHVNGETKVAFEGDEEPTVVEQM